MTMETFYNVYMNFLKYYLLIIYSQLLNFFFYFCAIVQNVAPLCLIATVKSFVFYQNK